MNNAILSTNKREKKCETLSLFVLSQSDLVLDVTKNRDENMKEDLKHVTPILYLNKKKRIETKQNINCVKKKKEDSNHFSNKFRKRHDSQIHLR